MLKEEKISIIIPVYNAENYIEECIQSILSQTYKNWELILIDDGSTDNSLCICKKYQNDLRIKIISKKNGGVSETRNKGIDVATGKYITFIDSDDFVDANYCSLLLSFMKEEISMVVLGLRRLQNNGNIKVLPHRLKSGYYSFQELQDKIIDDGTMSGFTLHSPCSILYKKELISRNSLCFDSKIKYNEDGLFNTLYFLSAKMPVYINYNITPYIYRENNCSATHTIDLTSDIYESNRQLVTEKLCATRDLLLPTDILYLQLKRRKVTLFLEEALYALRLKRADYVFFKSIIKKYNIKENISTLCFGAMKRTKRIIFIFFKLRFFFLVYCLLKITK